MFSRANLTILTVCTKCSILEDITFYPHSFRFSPITIWFTKFQLLPLDPPKVWTKIKEQCYYIIVTSNHDFNCFFTCVNTCVTIISQDKTCYVLFKVFWTISFWSKLLGTGIWQLTKTWGTNNWGKPEGGNLFV